MKKIIHLTLFLALIAALAGGALGLANSMTEPVIKKNELAAEKATLKKIYPDANDDAFEIVEVKGDSKTIEKLFKVKDKGYIFKMKVSGYKEGTSFLIALQPDGKIYDYIAISNGDTVGLGTKVTEDAFRNTLKGKDGASKDLLNDTITGSTITSLPVLKGIVEAADYLAANLK